MKHLLKLALICIVVSTPVGLRPVFAAFTKGPYIQNPGKTEMTIMWETVEEVSSTVFFNDGNSSNRKVNAGPPIRFDYKENIKNPNSPIYTSFTYKVKLAGLKAGTKYFYYVEAGKEKSPESYFKTISKDPGKFTFVVYGDNQNKNQEGHKRITSCINKHDPDFIINVGDMVTTGRNYHQWSKMLFDPLAEIIDHIPFWAVRGNHDGAGINMKRLLSPPDDTFYYSFDYGNAHFTILDLQLAPENLEWCDDDLGKSNAQWKFVFNHYPYFSMGWGGFGWGQETLLPVLEKHRVDISFTGHVHAYERFFPMIRTTDDNHHPITHIVTGGGGAMLMRPPPHPCIAKSVFGYHFLVVTVDGDNVTIEAYNADNEKFDSFTIRKKNGIYEDKYINLTRPEELMALHLALHNHSLYNRKKINSHLTRAAISKAPTRDNPIELVYNISIPDVKEKGEIEIMLSEKSRENYITEPEVAKVSITPGKTSIAEIRFSIKAKGEVMLFPKGFRIEPPLMFEGKYRIGKYEGRVRPIAVKYIPELKTH